MKIRGLFSAIVILVGVVAAASQETETNLPVLDGYFERSAKATLNLPWSVRTTVDIGASPKGP